MIPTSQHLHGALQRVQGLFHLGLFLLEVAVLLLADGGGLGLFFFVSLNFLLELGDFSRERGDLALQGQHLVAQARDVLLGLKNFEILTKRVVSFWRILAQALIVCMRLR